MLGDTKHESDTLPRGLAFFYSIPRLFSAFFYWKLGVSWSSIISNELWKLDRKNGAENTLFSLKKNRKEKNY